MVNRNRANSSSKLAVVSGFLTAINYNPHLSTVFGNTASQPSGGLFGAAGTGGNLFGNTQQNQAQQPAQAGGLFGAAKPTTGGGLFGGGTNFGQNRYRGATNEYLWSTSWANYNEPATYRN